MTTQTQHIIDLANAIGADIKSIVNNVGSLAALTTTDKTSLVNALNELKNSIAIANGNTAALINDAGTATDSTWSSSKITSTLSGYATPAQVTSQVSAIINDGATATTTTWSSTNINTQIQAAVSALVNNSPGALATLKALADAMGDDPNFATTISTQLGYRVSVNDVQTFTPAQQAQGCANLGIGNPDTDFVTIYNTAKA